MEALAKRLRATRLLGPLSTAQLIRLLDDSDIARVPAGTFLAREEGEMPGHLLILEGEVEVSRTWSVLGGEEMCHSWVLNPARGDSNFAFLGASSRVSARAVTEVSYIEIDAETVDELVGWRQRFSDEMARDPELLRRMNLIKQVKLFYGVPLENVYTVFARMRTKEVEAGETVVSQGEVGDCYYLIDSGQAEVIRTDPLTDETRRVAIFGPGDAFGEEALLQGGFRNATVTMVTPGRLLVLDKGDFDAVLTPSIVEEISPERALEMVSQGVARWLDCRYDMEYAESRIPGAQLASLDHLRADVHKLDPEATYIVYCRSGRRSKAAAYLLRERNINALSMAGGIKSWPYAVDDAPLDGY